MASSRSTLTVLTNDLYQLTMAFGYWRAGRHDAEAVFDYIFRRCPFGGEFAVFAGLGDLLDFLERCRFTDADIDYLRTGPLAGCDPAFFAWLRDVCGTRLRIWAVPEGSVVFPREPVVRVEGPLAIAQLLETPLLYALNFPSLITTNAVRYRLAAGPKATLIEFGLRRAQDGARASYYAYVGGFDGTSNVAAARELGITPRGTMAHSFVSSFSSLGDLRDRTLLDTQGAPQDFLGLVLKFRKDLRVEHTNDGELAAFVAYAQAFPRAFLVLVDTYDTLRSGVPNFICVALALHELGYAPLGIRIDSGDLAYLSREARRIFRDFDRARGIGGLAGVAISASNDINEETLLALRQEGHEIDLFGIGTHLVTCQRQPAFGGVYKLVAVDGQPRIKLSNDPGKIGIPGRKELYRLLRADGKAFIDLMTQVGAAPPEPGAQVLCRHPFEETTRVYVVPSRVVPLHQLVWDGRRLSPPETPGALRARVSAEIGLLREDHLRPLNPTPYKVAVSESLYAYMHELLLRQTPIDLVE
jgi:nicotinate phosphoribosyltransferase